MSSLFSDFGLTIGPPVPFKASAPVVALTQVHPAAAVLDRSPASTTSTDKTAAELASLQAQLTASQTAAAAAQGTDAAVSQEQAAATAADTSSVSPMLIVAGVAGVGMLAILGWFFLKKSPAKANVAGYRRRKRRSKR